MNALLLFFLNEQIKSCFYKESIKQQPGKESAEAPRLIPVCPTPGLTRRVTTNHPYWYIVPETHDSLNCKI